MIELLRAAADEQPDAVAVLRTSGPITYRELRERAEGVAGALRSRGVHRMAFVSDDAASVAAVLAGASLCGADACALPPAADAGAVAELADRFDRELVVTDRADLVAAGGAEDLAGLTSGADLRAAEVPDGPRPLLVLTTGTTGTPRGVRHDWARVVRASRRIRVASAHRWLLAYGLHQFAGLQILVHVLAERSTLVAPDDRRPSGALAAIDSGGVTHISATPTWWRFLLAELAAAGAPAPALQQITLGGEAAPDGLLRQLGATFPGARIAHVYAASEVGSTGSVTDGRAGFDPVGLRDDPGADVAMKVVDGELWVRSRIGMLGYWGEPPVDPDAWRPTGDLVEEVDGRLVFRGRATEVINVGGVKVHPLPVEAVVEAVPGVAVARVFGRANNVTGAIVAVEVVAEAGTDPASLKDAIRDACTTLPAAARPRSIRVVDDLPTVGGKRARRDLLG